MGGHLGDPYTIGGKRGMIPPASLSRVYSLPQQKQLQHMGLGPWALGQDTKGCKGFSVGQGFTDLRCLAPTRGAPMAPPSIGGGSVCSEFAGKFAGNHRIGCM